MTIPILPGPFSFLTGAGEALGAFGKGRSERNIYEQQQAQKNVEILTTLIARGLVDPHILAAHGTAAMLHGAGLPGLESSQIDTPEATTKARAYASELNALPEGGPQIQGALGIPTTQDVQIKKGAAAQARTAEIANTGLTVPQAQAKEGIVSAETAPLMQQAQAAGARKQTTESEGMQQILQSVQQRLPNDPEFSKVADYAAVHGLGFLTSQNDMWARLGSERTAQNTAQIRLISLVHNAALKEYVQATDIWAKSQDAEIKRQLNPLGPAGRMTEEEKNAIRNNIVKQYEAKRPKMETYLDKAKADYKADPEEYDAAVRDVAGGIAKAQVSGDRMAKLKALYNKPGGYTKEEINNDPGLTPEQKQEITGETGVYGPPAPKKKP